MGLDWNESHIIRKEQIHTNIYIKKKIKIEAITVMKIQYNRTLILQAIIKYTKTYSILMLPTNGVQD